MYMGLCYSSKGVLFTFLKVPFICFCVLWGTHMATRGPFIGIGSLLELYGDQSQVDRLGGQVLSAEPSLWS